MSYRQERLVQWGVWLRTVENMDIESKEIGADVLVAVLILAPIFTHGADPATQGALAAFVQSVKLPRAIRAYKEARYEVPSTESEQ